MLIFIKFIIALAITIGIGQLLSKMKLPAILGWLIGGMILGPHAFRLVSQDMLNIQLFERIIHILECSVGLMIGTELVWSKIKKSGKQIIITTFVQSLGTFLVVSFVFLVFFYFMNIPLYLAFIFGGIALATAPAPALSIVREFKTKGPVTNALIPMAALDDMVGVIVFFTVIAVVSSRLSSGSMSILSIILVILLPLIIGGVVGLFSGYLMKKYHSQRQMLTNLAISILTISIVGIYINENVLSSPLLNFMLMGMSFSAAFANIITSEQLDQLMIAFNPVLNISMVVVIFNLGAPLDYHLIFGAGLFTAIYIISRAIGKYFGARLGATLTGCEETVKKFLGLTLLPHSGVSLVFTGIAVSTLSVAYPEHAHIIQGTIAAAAVINEVLAVIIAKKGFEWAGEIEIKEPEAVEA